MAVLVGTESLEGHLIVKKILKIIEERNLTDPTDPLSFVADEELKNVLGVERYRKDLIAELIRNHIIW